MNNQKRKLFYLEQNQMQSTNDLPKSLFRYRPFNSKNKETNKLYDLEALENNKIWMSSAKLFNDPFDSMFKINGKLQNNQDISFCASFAERYDDVLMWSHYANYHKGVCIEYEFNKEKYLPILYMSTNDITFHKDINAIFVKHSSWEQEYEWRLLADTGLVKEHYEKDGFLQNFEIPKAIHLGIRSCYAEYVPFLLNFAVINNNIPVYHMYFDEQTFELKRRKLNES